MPADPNRVQAVFLLAVEAADARARVQVLERECGADAELRQRVEVLLKAHDTSDGFLNRPPVPLLPTVDHEPSRIEGPGSRIGPYKLLQQVGEGGMGVVFMAEQIEPVQRKVALKIIKPGMDTRHVVARFEAERQALALMDHPNIAKVLDAGSTDSGRPYFVMELVKGLPITKYCDQEHLTPHERLQLFVPVCHAVQHAHQKGIIHRDLKPSNILIALYDGKPVPKVIDFGVAKATGTKLTDHTLFTEVGHAIGTWEYMAPEQAEVNNLDIDTRVDIYALGATFYELLVGSPPFTSQQLRKAAFDERLRMIREVEPPRPSTRLSSSDELPSLAGKRKLEPAKLSRLLRGDLDWIVMKCLEKERSRRYETANGLAMDVQRYLADEPVLASPPSAVYRVRKFARRHKRQLLTASLLGVMLLAVVAILGWAVRDRAAREQEAGRDLATRQALIKERVMVAMEEARKRHSEGRWRAALDAAKRAEALTATGECDEETRQSARETLDDMQMLASLEQARVEATKNDAGFDFTAENRDFAQVFRTYGIDIDGLDRETAAMAIRGRSIRYELAVYLDYWSHSRRHLVQGGKDWKELLEIARAVDPDPWRDRFRKAMLDNDRKALIELAASAPISSLPAETVDRLGDALMQMDATAEAAAFLRKGQLVHPQEYWISNNLARSLQRLGQYDEAIRYFTAAVSLRPEATWPRHDLANALSAQGRHPDEVIAVLKNFTERAPTSALAHFDFGQALKAKGDLEAAERAYREAVRLDAEHRGAAIDALAELLQARGNMKEAISIYQKITILAPNDAAAHHRLVRILYRMGQPDDAIAAFKKAIEANTFKDKPSDHRIWYGYAELCLFLGKEDEYRRHRTALLDRFADSTDLVIVDRVARTSLLLPATGEDLQRAIAVADRDIDIGKNHGYYRFFMATKSLADYRLGRFESSIDWAQKAGDRGVWMPVTRLVLAMAQHRQGKTEQALQSLAEAIRSFDWRESTADMQKPWIAHVLRREAEALILPHLSAYLNGTSQPKDNQERLELLKPCHIAGHYLAETRLYTSLFANDPELADNMKAGHLYNAACAAALAAAGKGVDADKLDDKEYAALRKQALEWLRADLTLWTKQAASDKPADRSMVQQKMKHWLQDSDFAVIRDKDAMAKLPATERTAWENLWAEVAEVLKRAGAGK